MMTTQSEGQRLVQILRSLVAPTQLGRVRWKQTDRAGSFIHTTKSGYLIQIRFLTANKISALTGVGIGPTVEVKSADGLTLASYEERGGIASMLESSFYGEPDRLLPETESAIREALRQLSDAIGVSVEKRLGALDAVIDDVTRE